MASIAPLPQCQCTIHIVSHSQTTFFDVVSGFPSITSKKKWSDYTRLPFTMVYLAVNQIPKCTDAYVTLPFTLHQFHTIVKYLYFSLYFLPYFKLYSSSCLDCVLTFASVLMHKIYFIVSTL